MATTSTWSSWYSARPVNRVPFPRVVDLRTRRCLPALAVSTECGRRPSAGPLPTATSRGCHRCPPVAATCCGSSCFHCDGQCCRGSGQLRAIVSVPGIAGRELPPKLNVPADEADRQCRGIDKVGCSRSIVTRRLPPVTIVCRRGRCFSRWPEDARALFDPLVAASLMIP